MKTIHIIKKVGLGLMMTGLISTIKGINLKSKKDENNTYY